MKDPDIPHKHMPYTVDDSFFDTFRTKILTETEQSHKSSEIRKWAPWAMAAAAISGLVLTATSLFHTPSDECDFDDITHCFDNMTEDEQKYIIYTYQQDIFINETTN